MLAGNAAIAEGLKLDSISKSGNKNVGSLSEAV